MIRFFKCCFVIAKGIRQIWKRGGLTQVNIAQISRGKVLADKRVLITGGSAGIGFAIAIKCLSEGASVVITGRNSDRLEKVLNGLHNERIYGLTWDVSDTSLISDKVVDAERLLGGGIDVLVNNAGVLLQSSFFSTTEDVWEKTYAVNSKGLFFLSQKISNGWVQSGRVGKIINIASSGSILGASHPYRMTKWDVAGLTAGLGELLSPHGIIVNAIAPGRIATEMLNRSEGDNYYDTSQPVKRMGLPEEIAELAVFLMSDAANYIVGQTIVCDGGYTLKS